MGLLRSLAVNKRRALMFRSGVLALYLIAAGIAAWVLIHFAGLSVGTGLFAAIPIGLLASTAFAVFFLRALRRRSSHVDTVLELVDVPIWRRFFAQMIPRFDGGRSLRMIPVISELPSGNWKLTMECTSRVGFLGRQASTPIGQRARAAKSVLAARIFEAIGAKQWWTLRAFPAASEDDAVALVTSLKLVAPVATQVTAISQARVLQDVSLPGIYPIWAYEREYRTRTDGGWTRVLRGSVGAILFEVYSSGSPTAASWEEIIRMAGIFVERIRFLERLPAS